MGRKKQKKSPHPQPTSTAEAKIGGTHGREDVARSLNLNGTADAKKPSGKKKRNRHRYDHNHSQHAPTIDDCTASSPLQSSWFPEVKWISRLDDASFHRHQPSQRMISQANNDEHKSSTSHAPTNNIDDDIKDKDNNVSTKKDSDQSMAAAEPNLAKQKTIIDELLSELNQLKHQLMPAATACAEVINNQYQCDHDEGSTAYNTQSQSRATITTPHYEYRQARSICNPYECLGETFSKNYTKSKSKKKKQRNHHHQSFQLHQLALSAGLSQFVNRSAIKLSNIDALLGFCLVQSALLNDEHQQQPQKAKAVVASERQHNNEQPFVFVDLCGAPGGFSEYISYRHGHPTTSRRRDFAISSNSIMESKMDDVSNLHQSCYGFGMSLSGSNADGKGVQWALDHLKQFFHSDDDKDASTRGSNGNLYYHVCKGKDGTGSIYNWENVTQLQSEMNATLSCGNNKSHLAHLIVADGGFDAQRDNDNQESIALKLVVSQTAAALTLLRPGGSYVLKMFGFQDLKTRRMLHYLYQHCFDKMTFVKPILSRPASAERYLVCAGYCGNESGMDWDGLAWRDQMLSDYQGNICAQKNCTQFDEFVDSYDRSMLQLNIDSCHSIMNYLDEKKNAAICGDGSASVYKKWKQYIDPAKYEFEWQLV